MAYNLGLDVGIASLGFAGVAPEEEHILFSGVRIFYKAENPKDGSSLAAPRREKRALRRLVRRKKQRKSAIRRLFSAQGMGSASDIKQMLHADKTDPAAVWQFRKEGLHRALNQDEWMRALYHIAAHRGFQSTRKGAEPNDVEGRAILSGARELQAAMNDACAPTVGAYLASHTNDDNNAKRNRSGTYDRIVTRDLLREEVNALFEAQKQLGNPFTSNAFRESFHHEAFWQRPLRSSLELVGQCSFEPEEKRAPRFAYSAELFVLWQRIHNMRIKESGDERALTPDEKQHVYARVHNVKKTTHKQLRTLLHLSSDAYFKHISYRKTKETDDTFNKVRETAEKTVFCELTGYHTLKAILHTGSDNDWYALCHNQRDMLDDVARILSFFPDADEREKMLQAHPLSPQQINALLGITSFSKTVDLSLKAITKILPFMAEGLVYSEACSKAGYHHSRKGTQSLDFIPPFEDIRNPVVNRALAQARKVVNAIIQEHGFPNRIIIELSRNMGRNFADRKKIEREQAKNRALNDEARAYMAKEIFNCLPENITGEQILKYRLWNEQGHFCPYSGDYINALTLRDATATQIDHIIPYSKCFNDSYINKVLCFSGENQKKANRTSFEYMEAEDRISGLKHFISQHNILKKKAERLLAEDIDEDAWKERAMNDTRYIARTLKNHIQTTLPEDVFVQVCNGSLTANLRNMWGFPNKTRQNDRHHAIDAIVLACTTQSMVQQCATESIRQKKQKAITQPWKGFRKDAWDHVHEREDFFVSRMPSRGITGAAHEETIRSIRTSGKQRQIVQRMKLTSLSLAKLEQLVDKERNLKLYNVLKERLLAHADKADKAFATSIYMPQNNGAQGTKIRAVNIITSEKNGVEVNEGLASNGDMVRVDVYNKGGKFFLIPVYVHHFCQKTLPQRAILGSKPEDEWELMDDKDFIFSLHKNDLIRVKSKTDDYVGYYINTDRSTGSIKFRAHDNEPTFGKDGIQKKGVKSLLAFEKYTVDALGNISPELYSGGIKEMRRGVANSVDTKCSETDAP